MDLHVCQLIVNRGGYPLALTCKEFYHGAIVKRIHKSRALRQKDTESYLLRNLEILRSVDCLFLSSVNHLKKLKSLTLLGNTSMTAEGISGCVSVERLCIDHNSRIRSVSHMTNLKVLRLESALITQAEIEKVDVEELHVARNTSIQSLSHMRKLRVLKVRGECTLLTYNLSNLRVSHMEIRDCSLGVFGLPIHLTTLVADGTGISQESLQNLDLVVLSVNNCPRVRSVTHMKKLKELYARGSCGIDNEGILGLENLTHLDSEGNPRITLVARCEAE